MTDRGEERNPEKKKRPAMRRKELEGKEDKSSEKSTLASCTTSEGTESSVLNRAASVDILLTSPAGLDVLLVRAGLDTLLVRAESVDTSLGKISNVYSPPKSSDIDKPSKSASTSNMEVAGTVDTPLTGISGAKSEASVVVNKGGWMNKMMTKLLFWKSSESLPIEETLVEEPSDTTSSASTPDDQPSCTGTLSSTYVGKLSVSKTDSVLPSDTTNQDIISQIKGTGDDTDSVLSSNINVEGTVFQISNIDEDTLLIDDIVLPGDNNNEPGGNTVLPNHKDTSSFSKSVPDSSSTEDVVLSKSNVLRNDIVTKDTSMISESNTDNDQDRTILPINIASGEIILHSRKSNESTLPNNSIDSVVSEPND